MIPELATEWVEEKLVWVAPPGKQGQVQRPEALWEGQEKDMGFIIAAMGTLHG